MGFCVDRDVLAVEPMAFVDLAWASQERARVSDGEVTGNELSSATVDFAAAGVTAGMVALIGGVGHEVVRRIDEHRLEISRVRVLEEDEGVSPAAGTGLEVVIRTLGPQIERVHQRLLTAVGATGEDGDLSGRAVTVVSLGVMRELEVLGVLSEAYASAAGVSGENKEIRAKAERYRAAFERRCREAWVLVDGDGDGLADRRVSLGVVGMTRV
ncbi:MAG: hypothetical protein IT442_11930 [Phycisphaeraceae bacterium]|nr:hypothetical protein [Phycisphaeraceae bacterium]